MDVKNLIRHKKVSEFISEFNKNRNSDDRVRMNIVGSGLGSFTVLSGKETDLLSGENKSIILRQRQEEMKAFTQLLRNKF